MPITDLDAITIPPFSVYDGIEGLWQDDDRHVDLWSHYHANRVNTCLRITRARIRVFEWQVSDAGQRNNLAVTARAVEQLEAARKELSALEAKRDALEAARVKDSYAPKHWDWA